jgi:hypothetical protein
MSTDKVTPIYAAHLYPADAIRALMEARNLMTDSYNLLDLLLEQGKITEASPAGDARGRLDQALNMLEPDEEVESADCTALRLVVNNAQPKKSS